MQFAWLFYMISVLDNVRQTIGQIIPLTAIFGFLGAACVGLSYVLRNSSDNENKEDKELPAGLRSFVKLSKLTFILSVVFGLVLMLVQALLPTQKDAMYIVAGIGLVEAVQSDTAKTVASKSVQVIEGWLDEQLAKTGSNIKELSKKAGNVANSDTAKKAVEGAKQVANDAAKEAAKEVVKAATAQK